MSVDDRGHRKFVYGFARDALKRNATPEQIVYALELLTPLSGHKALGFRVRLQAKQDGKPWSWSQM
jgi:alkylhydroperoxidase/carboxymuconolactone decarboxylase family protein YurZ